MIAYLKGKIKFVQDGYVVLLVNDVGYKVETAGKDYMENQEVELFIHTHVREQEFRLFGFKSQSDLDLFEKLLGVTGVGPKVAMTLLSQLGDDKIIYAIENQNPHALKTNGVGIKTAEKIILELRNNKDLKAKQVFSNLPVKNAIVSEAVSALEGLGYKRYEIENEFSGISIQEDWGSEDIIKVLLKRLSRTRKRE